MRPLPASALLLALAALGLGGCIVTSPALSPFGLGGHRGEVSGGVLGSVMPSDGGIWALDEGVAAIGAGGAGARVTLGYGADLGLDVGVGYNKQAAPARRWRPGVRLSVRAPNPSDSLVARTSVHALSVLGQARLDEDDDSPRALGYYTYARLKGNRRTGRYAGPVASVLLLPYGANVGMLAGIERARGPWFGLVEGTVQVGYPILISAGVAVRGGVRF